MTTKERIKEVVKRASYIEIWENVLPKKTGMVFLRENKKWKSCHVYEGVETNRVITIDEKVASYLNFTFKMMELGYARSIIALDENKNLIEF